MKTFFLTLIISLFSCATAQEKDSYLKIDFTSICCGPPNKNAVINLTKKTQRNYKLKKMDIWVENGLGREGEYALYISLKKMTPKQKIDFTKEMEMFTKNLNSKRAENSDGYIVFNENLITHKMFMEIKENRIQNFSKFK